VGIKQKIGEHAGELIVLADHEKFEHTAFLKTWDFSEVALVITGTELPDEVLIARLSAAGIRVHPLSYYYQGHPGRHEHHLVVNYAQLDENALTAALGRTESIF
jgi:hypothetical protein